MHYSNVFYFSYINSIGGVESFFYYLAKKYQARDITVFYNSGDPAQIKRLSELVRVLKYRGQRIQCDKAFLNYTIDIIDRIDANEYYEIIHADYKRVGALPATHPKITKYLCCSKQAYDSFVAITGLTNAEVVYNPFVSPEPRKLLKLVSATRLTPEKGWMRMQKLGRLLDQSGYPYIWMIFTNSEHPAKSKNMIFMEPSLDVSDYVASADYLVQLSDHEGFCYSVVEALSIGTPVIVTDCPVFKEIGLNDSNSFRLKFDMSDVPIDDIYRGLPEFDYIPPRDSYGDILSDSPSTWAEEKESSVYVKVTSYYYDLTLCRMVKKGEKLLVLPDHAQRLVAGKVAVILPEE